MTGPPGPVIPCTTLRAWSLAVSGCWPARCSPRLRSEDGRRARKAVNRSRFSQPALSGRTVGVARARYRPADGLPTDRERAALAARIYDASHLTGTFTLRSGVVSNEYFDKYMFESDPDAPAGDRRGLRAARARPGSTRSPASSSAAIPLATMISQLSGLPDPLRPQGGQDLRHLPARRGRRARRPAALHHRRRRHLGRRDPRRRGRAPRAGRGPRTGRLRDRPRVGRRREARGRGPRAAPALPRCTSSPRLA